MYNTADKNSGFRCFITASDTGAGKTVASASLAAALRARNIAAAYAKAVETGCIATADGNALRSSECEQVAAFVASLGLGDPPIYAGKLLRRECSPHLAAHLEDVHLDAAQIASGVKTFAASCAGCICEGAGGALVPLNASESMADLMKLIDWPVLVVIKNTLGAINQSLMTVAALRAAGIEPTGLVFTHVTGGGDELILRDNRRTVEQLSGVGVVASIPHIASHDDYSNALKSWDSWLDSLGLDA